MCTSAMLFFDEAGPTSVQGREVSREGGSEGGRESVPGKILVASDTGWCTTARYFCSLVYM